MVSLNVTVGSSVKAGKVIGTADSKHLHYMRHSSTIINPSISVNPRLDTHQDACIEP